MLIVLFVLVTASALVSKSLLNKSKTTVTAHRLASTRHVHRFAEKATKQNLQKAKINDKYEFK